MICPFEKVETYRIYELYPRGGMGGAAFSVFLNHELANRIKQTKLSEIKSTHIVDVAKTILKNTNLDGMEHKGLYFYEDTFLLHWCRVDGNACEIGVEGNEIYQDHYDRPLGYGSHNIDTPTQAYGLLALWLH